MNRRAASQEQAAENTDLTGNPGVEEGGKLVGWVGEQLLRNRPHRIQVWQAILLEQVRNKPLGRKE